MATIFTHAFTAVVGGKLLWERPPNKSFWLWMVIFSILPDLDVVGFRFGIEYGDFWGHRGFSHSIAFAFLVAGVFTTFFYRVGTIGSRWWFKYTFFFAGAMISHGVLDAMTNGGLGVAFFSPVNDARYFLPWTPLEVSPIGVKAFLSERGLKVIFSELLWVIAPLGALYGFVAWRRRA